MTQRLTVLCLLLLFCRCMPVKPGGDRPDSGAPVDCHHAEPPPPTDAGAADGSYDLVFAVARTDIGAAADGGSVPAYWSIGFDLDNNCTAGASCVRPSWASGTMLHDENSGIDNAYGQLETYGIYNEAIDASAAAPEPILRVRNYSGGLDDDSVDVSFYVAFGLVPREDGGVGPFWDGQDQWMILQGTLAVPDDVEQPLTHSDIAYVTGGVLVARFSHALVTPGLANAPTLLVQASQLVMAGTIARFSDAGEGWEIHDLVIGFRTPLNDTLAVTKQIAYLPEGTPLVDDAGNLRVSCQYKDWYEGLKASDCAFADIASDPSAPPTAPCDALSAGVLFQAKQALIGGVAMGPFPQLAECDPSVPAVDTCDTLGDQ